MKKLLILRHAKSSWANMNLADYDRPLNKRGRRDAPRMGRLLRLENLVPDLIISSSARRARDTAEAVADNCGYEHEIELTRELYHADPESYIHTLSTQDDENQIIMIVGHNPGIEELVEMLTNARERMPTAALAYVNLPISQWSALKVDLVGRLMNIWIPKRIDV